MLVNPNKIQSKFKSFVLRLGDFKEKEQSYSFSLRNNNFWKSIKKAVFYLNVLHKLLLNNGANKT